MEHYIQTAYGISDATFGGDGLWAFPYDHPPQGLNQGNGAGPAMISRAVTAVTSSSLLARPHLLRRTNDGGHRQSERYLLVTHQAHPGASATLWVHGWLPFVTRFGPILHLLNRYTENNTTGGKSSEQLACGPHDTRHVVCFIQHNRPNPFQTTQRQLEFTQTDQVQTIDAQ
eukprot:scaffold90513_cov56-Attheya_sp.AAC.1